MVTNEARSRDMRDLIAAAQISLTALSLQIDALSQSARIGERPDPLASAKQLYRGRRARAAFFQASLFGEPGWDILLDLYIARAENRRISVSSACMGAAVPATTALRWLAKLQREGLIRRRARHGDDRRRLIEMTDEAFDRMTCLLLIPGESSDLH